MLFHPLPPCSSPLHPAACSKAIQLSCSANRCGIQVIFRKVLDGSAIARSFYVRSRALSYLEYCCSAWCTAAKLTSSLTGTSCGVRISRTVARALWHRQLHGSQQARGSHAEWWSFSFSFHHVSLLKKTSAGVLVFWKGN